MSVLGYQVCKRCGVPVLDLIAYKTDGLCPADHREYMASRLDVIELRGKGLRVPISETKPKTDYQRDKNAAKNKRRRQDPDRRRKERLREHAKRRAYVRLRHLFPEVFDVLMADERARAGLAPWSVDMALTPGSGEATVEIVDNYHRHNGAARRQHPASGDPAAPGQ